MTEREIWSNKPVELFKIHGKPFSVRLRPATKADEWLEHADTLDIFEAAISAASVPAEKTQARRTYINELLDLVLGYDDSLDASAVSDVRAVVTCEQLVRGFLRLRELTDPFGLMQSETLAQVKEMLGGDPDMIKTAMKIGAARLNISKPKDS